MRDQSQLDFAHSVLYKHASPEALLRSSFLLPRSDGTPLIRDVVGTGNGGQVRLKLYLTLLWLRGDDPNGAQQLQALASEWAELIGLGSPNSLGARRVNDAWMWLAENNLVYLDRPPGRRPYRVTALHESGSGKEHTDPRHLTYAGGPRRVRRENAYVRLSHVFWSAGWISKVTAPGLWSYLVLLDAQQRSGSPVCLSWREVQQTYGIRYSTWNEGRTQLRQVGLVYRKTNRGPEDRARAPYSYVVPHLGLLTPVPIPSRTSQESDSRALRGFSAWSS